MSLMVFVKPPELLLFFVVDFQKNLKILEVFEVNGNNVMKEIPVRADIFVSFGETILNISNTQQYR